MKAKSKLKLDKFALFGQLGYEPHEGQRAVHASTASRRIVACGVRWGKSLCASMEAIAAAMSPAESSLGWIVAPSYALTDLIFTQVRSVVEERLPHRIVRVENRERTIVLRNLLGGLSEIRGRSAENRSNLLGAGLDWLIVDEAAALREDVWPSYLSGRLVDRKGWALLLSTPRGRDWFYDLYRRGQKRDDPGYESWTQPSWANPTLDREAIELERGRVSQDVFDQEYGALFLGDLGRVCETCGAPQRHGPGCVVIFRDQVIAHCPECDRPVDLEGNPLGFAMPDGKTGLQVIHLGVPQPENWDGPVVAAVPTVLAESSPAAPMAALPGVESGS